MVTLSAPGSSGFTRSTDGNSGAHCSTGRAVTADHLSYCILLTCCLYSSINKTYFPSWPNIGQPNNSWLSDPMLGQCVVSSSDSYDNVTPCEVQYCQATLTRILVNFLQCPVLVISLQTAVMKSE